MTAGLVALAGCHTTHRPTTDGSGLPADRPVKQADLLRYPQAHLYYPGSQLVKTVGADQTPTHPGEEPNPAYLGAILTVAASPPQLYDWYGRQLGGRGYVPAIDYRPSTQVSGQAWQSHHRLQVQVGVFDPVRLQADQGIRVAVPPGTVVYEVILVGYPPGLPKVVGDQ